VGLLARAAEPSRGTEPRGVTFAVLGLIICIAAAVSLSATPLFIPTVVLACINGACLVVRLVVSTRDRDVPRALTFVQHVTVALGSFLLLASLSLP
jgi:hypothetical protein